MALSMTARISFAAERAWLASAVVHKWGQRTTRPAARTSTWYGCDV